MLPHPAQVYTAFTLDDDDLLQEGSSIRTKSHPTVAGGPEALVPPQATVHLTSFSQIPVDTQVLARAEHGRA
jgi:hypothetical protein